MMRALVVALACLLTFCIAQNPCTFTENNFYSYDYVRNCYYSVFLTDEVKYTTLQTLQRSLELYAFYDIAHNSPDPNLPLQVSMQKGLDEIANRPYIYDFDFQNDLRYLYIQLRDAHTQYYLPNCYQNVLIRQPFAPVGSGNTTDNFTIRIAPYFPADLLQLDPTLTNYVNYTIISIDGVPAYQYFMTYANTSVGMSKDVGTRFNYALTIPEPRDDIPIIQYSYWQQRTHRNPFPTASNVTYVLQSPTGTQLTLSKPWTFKALKTYASQHDFLSDYYNPLVPQSSSTTTTTTTPPPPLTDSQLGALLTPYADEWRAQQLRGETKVRLDAEIMEVSEYTKEKIREDKQARAKAVLGEEKATAYTFELLVNTTHLTFWQLSDNKTLVMYLDTMEPGRFSGYYPALIEGFEKAAQRGLTQLIIDLTNNGGGNICLGQSLLAYLQQAGWEGQGQNWGPQDLPLSPLAEQLIHAAVTHNVNNTVWSPGFYDDQQGNHIENNDTSKLLPGVPHVRGGRIRNYSKLLHIEGCGDFGYQIKPAVDFKPSNTLILTKGLCGSTCALFANHMRLYDNVRTVVLGGMPGRPQMQYTSFPGLQVLDNRPLFGQLAELRQDISWTSYQNNATDIVPRILPTTSDFRYCIREIYPNVADYDTIPMEYNFQQADYHYFNDQLTSVYPQYFWYYVLDLFSS